MVDVMNELNIDAAVYGNHEFDFGIGTLQDAIKGTISPKKKLQKKI